MSVVGVIRRNRVVTMWSLITGLLVIYVSRMYVGSSKQSVIRKDHPLQTTVTDARGGEDSIQAVRLSRLRRYCQYMNLSEEVRDIEKYLIKHKKFLRSLANTMLIDENHQLILRSVPKTGCSTWRLTFLNNSVTGPLKVNKMIEEDIHLPHFMNKYNLRQLAFYTDSEASYRLQSYPSIITVRHPLDRMESAYVDKFTKPNIFNFIKEKHSKKIFHLYRGQTLKNANPKNVTFEEFLRYMLEYPASDIHWRSVWDQAHPCILEYNYIAKQETMDLDLDYVTDTYLSGKHTSIKLKSWRHGDKETLGKLLPLFSKLPHPESWIQKLLVEFSHDMKMFGYSYKVVDGQVYATCERYTENMLCV